MCIFQLKEGERVNNFSSMICKPKQVKEKKSEKYTTFTLSSLEVANYKFLLYSGKKKELSSRNS